MRNAVEMVRSIALFGVVAFAINVLADEATVNGQTWNYSIQDGKARIERRIDSRTGECGYSGDLIVPTRINGKPVVEVDRYAFSRGTAILSVVIPSGVLLEDKFRFEGCTALKSVKISEPMSEITSAMFENCSALVSVDMPAEVTRIGAWAFYGCTSLKSLNALSVVVEVGEKAFYGCMNLAMTINLGVLQKIGTEAFYDCGKMLFTGSPTLVTRIPDYAFYGCDSLYDMNVVPCITEIGAYAFGCCSNLVSLTGIGDNVLQIGEGAFSGCSKITSMHIPSNLKSIPSSLFRGCKSLECVVMGNGVTNIEKQAFSGCSSLDDMKLSPALESIGEYAFSGCPTAFPLPASVRKIDWHIFSAPVDELVLDGCVTKDMEWPFTRREVGTYYDQDPYNGHYYRDYSKDVASGVLKIFEWNDTGENFHLTLEDSWSLYYTDASITPFRTGREYHEWSPPIVYRRDAEISIVPAARSVIQGRTAISLLAPHEDVELFYTIDGSDPRTNGIKYEQKFSIRGKTTVRAVGYFNGKLTTKELVAKYGSGEVSTPVITSSQPEFNFSGNQIAITCATSGVEIHYTTDGSEPTADSPLYSAPFCIDETTMIKAIAVGHAEYMDSLIAVREFKREWLTVPSPVVSPGDGGSFDTIRGVVTIECPLSGATIYYTTDGTKPTRQSPVYSGPFEIDSDTVVRAFASKVDYLDSAFVKATIYNRQPFAATPVISLAGGGNSFVGSKGVVSIACATEGAVLHYTLDGSTPTAESPIYMEPFGITETTTVKAFASKLGCRDSEVVSATFEKQWAYGDSLDCPDLMFTSEGGDWVNDPNVSYDGKGSLRSPLNPQDGKEYSFSTEISGSQSVSFYWKTSCEKDEWDEFFYDHAEFWVDDVLVAQLDGREDDWQFVFCPIEYNCAHVLSWVYVKDGSGAMGDDCVWIDYLKLDEERADCEVSFDPRDESGNVTKKIYQIGSRLGDLDTPTWTGYDFVGWFCNGVQVTYSTIVSGDMILYGRWVTSRTWSYSKVKGGIEITGVNPATGDLIIPNQIDGFDVVGIGEKAFYKCGDIISVTIPEKVVSISRNAFWQCTGLKSVNVLSLSNWCRISLTSSQYGPLCYAHELLCNGVRVEKLVIPPDVVEIAAHAFNGCTSITSVVVTPNVRKIGSNAFKGCSNMLSLEVQKGVTNIEVAAFAECSSLRVARLPDGANIQERAFQTCSQLQKVVLPSDLKEISTRVFGGCSSLVDVKIPDGVQKIGDSSFMSCAFRSLAIPNGVTEIAQFAFGYCQLESVVIPSTVRTIGRYAFEECPRLEFVDLGEGVESLGDDVFFKCPLLRAIVVHRSLTTVGVGVFSLCWGMKTVYVEDADGERVKGVLDRTGFEDPVSYVELSKAIPSLDCVPMGAKVSDVVAGFGDPRLKENVCNEEEYSLYRDWAMGCGSGLAMVRESRNSWTSYALDLDALLAGDLISEDIRIMDLKQQQGTDGFDVVFGLNGVAIGERASADNLKKVFEIEGAESLGVDQFSSANVLIEFDRPEAGKVKVKARPHGKPSAFFMRIGLKN